MQNRVSIRCAWIMAVAAGLVSAGMAAAEPVAGGAADTDAAIATVERFSTAITAGEFDRAAAELDPDVVILESGAAELSAAEYLAGHARHDHEFLKSATVEQRHRRASASGELAWVATVATIRLTRDDRPLVLDSTETMVLRRDAGGWKIVHIHWSSHAVKD